MHPFVVLVWICFLTLPDGHTVVIDNLSSETDCVFIALSVYPNIPLAQAKHKVVCASVQKVLAAAD